MLFSHYSFNEEKDYNRERMGYSRNALQGISWNGTLKVFTAALTIFKIYMLSRLLSQQDFGLFSLTAIALGITEALTETGINTIIVNSKKGVSYFLDTAWIISIVRGLIISIVMILAGVFMQGFYQEEKLLLMVSMASFVPLIKGFINPAVVTFQKELRFFQDTVYRFSLELVATIATIVLAVFFQTPYVFVWGMVIAAIWEVFFSFVFLSERPKFQYLPSRAQEIWAHAKGLNLSAILSYAVQNIDNLLIGKVLGTQLLGVYANGYSLSHRMTLDFAKTVQHATFPVYVKIVHEPGRLRRAFFKTFFLTIGLLLIISFPVLLFPRQIVEILLSEKWLQVAAILPGLFLAGIIQSIVGVTSTLLIVRKKLAWLNANLFVTCVFLVALVPWLSGMHGLIGAVIAVVLARIFALPVLVLGIRAAVYEE